MRLWLLAIAAALVSSSAVKAAEIVTKAQPKADDSPTLTLDGSIGLARTDNAFQTPNDRRPDWYLNPDFTLTWTGNLPDGFQYQFYAEVIFDAFAKEHEAHDSFSLIGAQLKRKLFDWDTYVQYENRQYYTLLFGPLDYIAHDFKVGTSRELSLFDPLTIAPKSSLAYRHSENLDVRRYLLDLAVGIEWTLTPVWAIVSTPQLRNYWFVDGVNFGRHDTRYTVSLGLKHKLSKAASVTVAARYEAQDSNFPDSRYRAFEIGASLDFSLLLLGKNGG